MNIPSVKSSLAAASSRTVLVPKRPVSVWVMVSLVRLFL